MTFARCVKLVIACVVLSACVHVSTTTTTTADTDSWIYAYDEFPNPQLDVSDCGNNGSRSWVCDPGRLLTPQEVDALDKKIEELRTNDSCQGWVAAIAVVPRIRLKDGSYPSNSDDQLDATRELADYLRRTSWRFGKCNNGLVIVRSHTDRKVWTSTASGVRKKLTDDCVDSIFQQARNDFKELNYATAFTILLEQYQRVQTGRRECADGGGGGIGAYVTYIVLGVMFTAASLGGCVYWCTKGGRRCCGEGGGGGGGHYGGGGGYGGGGDCGGGGGGDGGGGGGGGD